MPKARWVLILVLLQLVAGIVTAAGAQRSVFTRVVAFPIKTDFRIAVAWETTGPVEAVVRYGRSPSQLTETVTPEGVAAAPSQLVFIDVDPGQGDVYLQVEDLATGDKTPIQRVVPKNSYRSYDKQRRMYTVNLAIWLDGENSPAPGLDADLGLIAEGVNVMAERVYDALDGSVRIGQVVIADAPVGRAPHVRTFQYEEQACAESGTIGADVVFMTAFPSSSEVNGKWTIDDPCGVVYLGRVGPYGGQWSDELLLGGIMTHELMHYAFGLADQYPKPEGIGDGDASCTNEQFDLSLMNIAPRYVRNRWEYTELDRNAEDTPCDHGTVSWSWPTLTERYVKVPTPVPNIPERIVDDLAKGNPDGGALEIWILDHLPGQGATLTTHSPQD
ncbi:MAG TPA: hypothetical protein VNC78_08160 [Actinomycetota bacterium]|nr:hypothetical protein [Actinomycetota bacterium]